jgi:hypothetical protein
LEIYTLRNKRHTNPFDVLSKKSSDKYSGQRRPKVFEELDKIKRFIKCMMIAELKRKQRAGHIIRMDYFHICKEVMVGCLGGRRSMEKCTGR